MGARLKRALLFLCSQWEDWAASLALVMLNYTVLNRIPPLDRYHVKGDAQLAFPTVQGTVSHDPFWTLIFAGPAAVFGAWQATRFWRGDWEAALADWHAALLALTSAFSIASTFKHGLQRVGELRPDWFARLASGDAEKIADGRKSFPSGNACYAFVSMGIVSLHALGRLRLLAAPRRGRFALLLLCLSPVALATALAMDRVASYHHHFQDTIAGGVLGSSLALLCYCLYFYSPMSPDLAGIPRLAAACKEAGFGCDTRSTAMAMRRLATLQRLVSIDLDEDAPLLHQGPDRSLLQQQQQI